MSRDVVPPVDYHVHTVYSGHAQPDATVEKLIRVAEDRGLREIAFLEHFDAIRGEKTLERIRQEVAAARPRIRVLVGAECDLDLADPKRLAAYPKRADLVGFSVHYYPTTTIGHWEELDLDDRERQRIREVWFDAIMVALAGYEIDFFCHPFFAMPRGLRMRNYGGAFLDSVRPILALMAARNIAFELNNTMPSKNPGEMLDGYLEIIKEAKSRGLKFAVGGDSHDCARLGGRDWICAVANEAGLGPEDFLLVAP